MSVDRAKAGKLEVYDCVYPDYLVRYNRWSQGIDRLAYYDSKNPGAVKAAWRVSGRIYGTQWLEQQTADNFARPYQWTATYGGQYPFSVTVEAKSAGDRAGDTAQVRATRPDFIPVAAS